MSGDVHAGFCERRGVGLPPATHPLVSHQVIIDLIGTTTTSTGLKVYARLDPNEYLTKVQVTDEQLRTVNITGDAFHPEWNYVITPSVIES